MYRLMRNVHLILGLVFALALGVYLLSSVRLAHRSWFTGKPTISEETLAVDPSEAGTPRALGLHLMAAHGLRGEIARVQTLDDGAFSLAIRRIGTNHQVRYEAGASEAQVRTSRLVFTGMLMGMHFTYGFWHESPTINLWSGVMLLTSFALFLMGASGIYLWFKTYEERRIGSVLLAGGLIFAVSLMVFVRIQG